MYSPPTSVVCVSFPLITEVLSPPGAFKAGISQKARGKSRKESEEGGGGEGSCFSAMHFGDKDTLERYWFCAN